MPKQIKILFASYEVAPFYKYGGLADVAGSLPKAIKELGVDIRVIMPYYAKIKKDFPKIKKYKANIYKSNLPKSRVPIYFLDNKIFQAKNIFDKLERTRFITFSFLVLEAIEELGWLPDVIHCNDWQTAIIPKLAQVKTLFTIHNIGYAGRTKLSVLSKFGFVKKDFLEIKHGRVNLMQQAILNADLISTVSPTYAKEILTPDFGYDMAKALNSRKKDLYGIINGLDYSLWPAKSDKAKSKAELQKICALPEHKDIPIVAMISRLAGQKGFDLVMQSFDQIIKNELQFVVLGTGAKEYQDFFKKMNQQYPAKFKAHLKFDLKLARQIYAGADMFLMPSKYEPCGLGQLIAMHYGTIPIVRQTGGLADTVKKDIGFSFKDYCSSDMLKAIKKTLKAYSNQEKWLRLVKNATKKDFSWKVSAKKYLTLYQKII